jgi:hypothetical protein
MAKLTVLALRGVIALLLAGSVFVQTVMVALMAVDMDDETDLAAYQRVAFLVIVVLGIFTVQIVLACV